MAGKALGTLALLLASPLALGSTGLTTTLDARVLAAHNRERATLDIPPLGRSPALARSAQAWADTLARTGAFEHAPQRDWDPQGENLWAGTRGYFSAETMVGAWIAEKRLFKPGLFPNNSRTGDYMQVGHYTQLMWRSSTHVGCARAQSRTEDLLVCRYSEAGNVIGERPF